MTPNITTEIISLIPFQSIDDDIDSLRSRSDLTSSTTNTISGVTSWGTAFEKLLEDPAGLNTFAEFLKKEFSAENIYFWTSCERYRQLDDAERSKEAIQIFSKHLGVGASEPGKYFEKLYMSIEKLNFLILQSMLILKPELQLRIIYKRLKVISSCRYVRHKYILKVNTFNIRFYYDLGSKANFQFDEI